MQAKTLVYAPYFAALSGAPLPESPVPGCYRTKARRTDGKDYAPAKSWPVVIWLREEDSKLSVMLGKHVMAEGTGDFDEFAGSTWLTCKAVPRDQYEAVAAGGAWPDESEAVTRSNRAPTDDSFEAIKERIDDLAREAQRLLDKGAATSKEECDAAADLANEIGKYERKADTARKAEKQPHVDAAKDVDTKWSTVITAAAIYKRLKAVVVTPFLNAQARAAEEARFQATLTGTPDEQLPSEKVTAGSRGRAVALRTVKAVEITDRAALLDHFKEHGQVTDLLQLLAERSVRTGLTPPGVKVTESKVAA